MRVAIQGIRGSYSEEAAMQLCRSAELVECRDFKSVFEMLERGGAGFAVVPVENKITGRIDEPAAKVEAGAYKVADTISLSINHVLAGQRGAALADIRFVRSHEQAVRQCGRFFAANGQIEVLYGGDTASSVREVVRGKLPEHSAVCSPRAADLFGADILVKDIADELENWTRFVLIERI